MARFARPTWIVPDTRRYWKPEKVFPATTFHLYAWTADEKRFLEINRLSRDEFISALFNLEGFIICRRPISTTALWAALLLVLGDIAEKAFIPVVPLQGESSFTEAQLQNQTLIGWERMQKTRYSVWPIYFESQKHCGGVVVDLDRQSPQVWYFDSIKTGRRKRMSRVKRKVFGPWFGRLGCTPAFLKKMR